MKKKRFKAHDNLIVDVIKRQSGTVGKAVLEGVMNSIDAGATRVDVVLKAGSLSITDDGKGFASEAEVDEYFATFGTPHETDEAGEVKDARFGEFRMGRGQLFAFGQNVWITNAFELRVDINKHGLDFHLEKAKTPHKGCQVHVGLYERLDAPSVMHMTEEITRNCQYVDITVTLNGKQINTPPANASWTEETEDAYIKVANSSSKGIDFYQQGVFVQTIPAWQIGASGIIVTKQRVKLNFARNEVMRSDTRFKRIMTKFKDDNEERLSKKESLSDEERIALCRALASEGNWGKHRGSKIFVDTSGRGWSLNMLTRLRGTNKYETRPSGKIGYSFAAVGDVWADKIMQRMSGLVFDEKMLEHLNTTPKEFFKFEYNLKSKFEYVPLMELAKSTNSEYHLVPEHQETKAEKRIIKALSTVQWDIIQTKSELLNLTDRWGRQRTIRIGMSDAANGWTDGSSYIALNRDFIKRQGTARAGLMTILNLFIHELCHDDDDTGTHVHSVEFYKIYHDITMYHAKLYGNTAEKMNASYVKQVDVASKKVSSRRVWVNTVEEIHAQNEELLQKQEANA